MKLVYDLRYATDVFPGIGTHAHALAKGLLAGGLCAQIKFLWDPRARNTRFDLEPMRRHPRARWVECASPALSVGTPLATGRLLAKLEADVYLSPFWLRPEFAGLPCVLTLHDVLPLAQPRLMSGARRWAYTCAMQRAARAEAVITSSRFSRDEILRHTRIAADRLHVVPLGVELESVPPQRPAALADGPFALVVAANRAHKGLETLARVWHDFGAAAPLRLVSAGAQRPGGFALEERTRGQAVQVLGHVSMGELEWLYRHATLVLVPSLYEGFGLPLLEAAARGAAVVAARIPALLETGEGVAEFVEPLSADAWRAAITELAASPARREAMRTAGLERLERYRHVECAAGVERVLQQVAAARPGVHA